METINITTSHNVQLDYELAGIGERIAAYLTDMVIIVSYFALVVAISIWFNINNPILMLAILIPIALYHLLLEYLLNGQSLGKKLMKIAVVKIDGTHLSFGTCLIRWLLRLIDLTVSSGAIALTTIIVGGKGQRLGDIAAGTAVVKLKSRTTLDKTVFEKLADDYTPVYTNAILLSDSDVQLIRDVLIKLDQNSNNSIVLIDRTRQAISKKMGVDEKGDPVRFLRTVLNDYNYYGK
jgi:uncharacterized RDD family membrane protein YckC